MRGKALNSFMREKLLHSMFSPLGPELALFEQAVLVSFSDDSYPLTFLFFSFLLKKNSLIQIFAWINVFCEKRINTSPWGIRGERSDRPRPNLNIL